MKICGVDSSKDVYPILVGSDGRVYVDGIWYTPVHKYVALSTTNETTVWDPTTGTKFAITDYILTSDVVTFITFRDGTAGSTILYMGCSARGQRAHAFKTPLISTTADNILTAQASAANAWLTVLGYEI